MAGDCFESGLCLERGNPDIIPVPVRVGIDLEEFDDRGHDSRVRPLAQFLNDPASEEAIFDSHCRPADRVT